MTTNPVDVLRVLAMLVLGGIIYNYFVVDKIERRMPIGHGVTAFEVVGGVVFTLAGFALLAGVEAMLLALLCFAASGVPMIVGSLQRASAMSNGNGDK